MKVKTFDRGLSWFLLPQLLMSCHDEMLRVRGYNKKYAGRSSAVAWWIELIAADAEHVLVRRCERGRNGGSEMVERWRKGDILSKGPLG